MLCSLLSSPHTPPCRGARVQLALLALGTWGVVLPFFQGRLFFSQGAQSVHSSPQREEVLSGDIQLRVPLERKAPLCLRFPPGPLQRSLPLHSGASRSSGEPGGGRGSKTAFGGFL